MRRWFRVGLAKECKYGIYWKYRYTHEYELVQLEIPFPEYLNRIRKIDMLNLVLMDALMAVNKHDRN